MVVVTAADLRNIFHFTESGAATTDHAGPGTTRCSAAPREILRNQAAKGVSVELFPACRFLIIPTVQWGHETLAHGHQNIGNTQHVSNRSTCVYVDKYLAMFDFLKITEIINFREQYLKMISRISKLFPVKKNLTLGSYFKFGVIWGQISDIAKSRQIIPQNEALDENFSKKLVSGAKKVIIGQKCRKMA